MFRRFALKSALLTFLSPLLFSATFAAAAPWLPFGPDGGDARKFAIDPHDHTHLYLGTANGWIYETHNSGANWRRLSRVGKRDDLVIDNIVVDPSDPKHLIAGAWVGSDGGLFITYDGGATWTSQAEMRGQSVRSLTSAPSDPKIIVAGTLKGVYRSTDGGRRWRLISPPDSTEIHEVESVAIDPKDPNIVYAGTWHLPWKTVDAGENWDSIKQGIIDDSDVFSIIIDPNSPKVVYASACSGIYKSEDAGTQFHKIQGIPSTARRTRVLLQDPSNLDIVFAGTTEGLFRSTDAGKQWQRTTTPEIIINDVFVDPTDPHHVLLATDRGGILASDDGGDTFRSSNGGFSARQVATLKRDNLHPATIFVGVVNDKEWGGIFQSDNGGIDWAQRSEGLKGRDVFSLGQSPDGTMIAGTAHGIFRLDRDAAVWNQVEQTPEAIAADNAAVAPPEIRAAVSINRNQFAQRNNVKPSATHAAPHTTALKNSKGKAFQHPPLHKAAKPLPNSPAARKAKLLAAKKHTAAPSKRTKIVVVKKPQPVAPPVKELTATAAPKPHFFDGSVFAITTSDQTLLAATSAGLLASSDQGVSWKPAGPPDSAEWRYLASAKNNVVAASLHGVQFSPDSGADWSPIRMPEKITLVTATAVEPSGEIWVGGPEGIFVSSDAGNTWTTPKNLFTNSVTSIYYDDATNRILVTAVGSGSAAFMVQLPQKTVTYTDTGWNLRFVRPVGDHLVAATFFDGIVIQPKMMSGSAPKPETAAR
ncbi:WD40/YVTN/BNR-like repeat-containing protein [Granulicella tundricola]|uniref:Photosynthesis system II assembly factor Ycf48/Hcf136-like domain-containing protein n=1 Tax=Granulicella tundricola (strain ATCC BAA-1859 / DSM 23138 / MP5ACTX9) TaxID=1198114 RepID=E8X382_GRATM|nr:hypothetical protein [Granulicella tundricola]ADW69306.1 hypothetical protein AciX9_2268 [Granulicella tundricola MP5ACTX9]